MFEKLQELPLLIGLSINELMAILENVKFEFNKYPEGTTVVNHHSTQKAILALSTRSSLII